MISIDKASAIPLYQQVYEQLAHGIEQGRFPASRKLPSIRECARELGVSNTTIELAYQRLTEEGYVQARRGSGYVICQVDDASNAPDNSPSPAYLEALARLAQAERERLAVPKPRFDFAYDRVDSAMFPYAIWARISRDVLFSKGAEAACLYTDRQGLVELRQEIAHFLASEHGLTCVPEQVLVMPTTRDLMTAVTALFDPATTTFAMEEPGYDEVERKLRSEGFSVRTLPVWPMPSWDEVERLLEGAGALFTTPACQFPSNRVMPIELRERLLEWAGRTDAYLIDDEYGWEFQTGAGRMPSLAALDRTGRVIAMGTFSNSFAPAICLSYAVLPPQLMLKWQAAERDAHPQVPWQTQAAMAAFMHEGHWRSHVRKIRTSAQRKQQALVEALHAAMGDAIEVIEGPSSLFVLVQTRDGRTEDELIAAAADAGVRVYPTRRYWGAEPPDEWRYLLIGYAGIPLGDIQPGIEALARSWGF